MTTTTLKPFNPEPKRLWVQALRGDEFEQAHGAFVRIEAPEATPEDDDPPRRSQHCCLAVATAVAIRNGVETVRERRNTDGLVDAYERLEFYDWEQGWVESTDPAPVAEQTANAIEWTDGLHSPDERLGYGPPTLFYRWVEEDEGLPDAVKEWLSAEARNPAIFETDSGGVIHAISANDVDLWSYAKIADAVEEYR